jgi:endonuclease/exonuclease/phosphatase family metal-dependent hydrolase
MRVMSFNLRYDNPGDGDHTWSARRPAVKRVLEEYGPDLLGIQEGLPHQVDDLRCWLSGHTVVGRGREVDLGGEHCSIFFRTSAFELLDHGDFSLSETPDVPGSKSWGTHCPRMVTWAFLRNKEHGRKVLALNTHLDYGSELARAKSAELILSFIRSFADVDGVLITGDFNDTIHGVVRQFTEDQGYVDALAAVNETGATVHGFTGQGSARIDYVLVSQSLKAVRGGVITGKLDGFFPSDHFPIYADLCWSDG